MRDGKNQQEFPAPNNSPGYSTLLHARLLDRTTQNSFQRTLRFNRFQNKTGTKQNNILLYFLQEKSESSETLALERTIGYDTPLHVNALYVIPTSELRLLCTTKDRTKNHDTLLQIPTRFYSCSLVHVSNLHRSLMQNTSEYLIAPTDEFHLL